MAIWIVLPILTLLMFDLGLTLRLEDFGKVVRRPWPLAVAMFGQLVLLPLIALALAWAFGLTPVFFIGLVLIACCPGGSSSNVFSKLAGGDVALSVTLTALSSVITLFTIPVIMSWATPTKSNDTWKPRIRGIVSFSRRNNFWASADRVAINSSKRLIAALEIKVEMFGRRVIGY